MVTPNLAAGGRKTGSPRDRQGGRRAEDRVAAREGPLGPLTTGRRRAADRVTPNWMAGGPQPGSPFSSRGPSWSHHLLDGSQRRQYPGRPP